MTRALAVTLTALCSLALSTPSSAQSTRPAGAVPQAPRINVPDVCRQLSSPNPLERSAAVRTLSAYYNLQADEIDAATKRDDLDPQAAAELQRIITRQRPRHAAFLRNDRIVMAEVRANQGAALAAYDKVGKRNPAWDDAARQYIRHYTFTPGDRELRQKRATELPQLRQALTNAGCDDPLVRYFLARDKAGLPDADLVQLEADARQAAEDLEASQYPAERKCWAHARYVDLVYHNRLWEKTQLSRDEVQAHFDRAVDLWPEVVASDGMTDAFLSDLADLLANWWPTLKSPNDHTPGDRSLLCDRLLPAWEKAYPKSVGPLLFKGQTYTQYAWDARGRGFANTVTDDGWKLMAERLQIAREALEKAHEIDPSDPRPPTAMITVELGSQSDRTAMERWWRLAMDANPDNYDACGKKLYYLEPKWHGSPMDMINFGRQCLQDANWEGRIPFILVDAHHNLSKYAPNREAYFAHPAVWPDIRAVYEPYLIWYPGATRDRSYFAFYACLAGQWDVAAKHFDILGDNVNLAPFKNKAEMELLREKARSTPRSTPRAAPSGQL